MGALRIILALSVVLMHAGGFLGYVGTGGSVAVQSFFIVSGFYMAMVLTEKYNRPQDILPFYKARATRIYGLYYALLPLYLALAVITCLRWNNGPLPVILYQGAGTVSFWYLVFANLLVFGQDIALFLASGASGLHFDGNVLDGPWPALTTGMLIMPAWSLAIELMFYGVAPFLLRRSTPVLVAICLASIAARLVVSLAGWAGDPWSYRFFPFELMHFLLGVLAYRAYRHRKEKVSHRLWRDRAIALAVLGATLCYPLYGDTAAQTYFSVGRIAYLSVVAAGLPGLFRLTSEWSFDRAVGNLSYPVYLVHMLCIMVIEHIPGLYKMHELQVGVIVAATLAAAWVVERVVDQRIELFRKRLMPDRAAVCGQAVNS